MASEKKEKKTKKKKDDTQNLIIGIVAIVGLIAWLMYEPEWETQGYASEQVFEQAEAGGFQDRTTFEIATAAGFSTLAEWDAHLEAERLAREALEKKASEGGFSSVEDMEVAATAGFSDNESYQAYLTEERLKKAAAEAERMAVEGATSAGERAGQYQSCAQASDFAASGKYTPTSQTVYFIESGKFFRNQITAHDVVISRGSKASDAAKKAYRSAKDKSSKATAPNMYRFTERGYAVSYWTENCREIIEGQCMVVAMRSTLENRDSTQRALEKNCDFFANWN